MSLKNLKKIFVVCFLSGACTSLNARATLPFLDEWAKSLDYFNEKVKYVDLTWGAVAIETGFIHNLRFFGDYQIEVEKGKRIYANDKSEDPLFAIIRELFPSTGGVLSATVNANSKLCNELSCIATALIIKNYFLEASAQSKANIKSNISSYITSKTLKKENSDLDTLLDNIEKIINTSDNHTQEVLAQVLLAFLYEKINLQGTEINDTTKIYKEETVGKLKSAFGKGMFLATIPQIEEETEYNKASIAARKYFNDLWQDNPFPYIAAPIQNGLAQVIQNNGTPRNTTFPDCVEVAIRHFFNIILYNPLTGNFDYENFPIVDAKEDLFSNFYKNLQPTRDLANNGSIKLRTEWNKIMTHIPEVIYKVKDDGKSINANELTPYNKTENENVASNEIKAGVINLYNVLAYLLKKDPIQTGTKSISDENNTTTRYGLINQYPKKETSVKSMLVKKFKELFKIQTVTIKKVNLTFYDDDNNNKDECDLYGDIAIEGTKTINELEYKFKFEMLKGHGLLTLLTPKPFEDKKFNFNTPYPESLLLLIDKEKFMDQKDKYPLYWSFHGPLMLDPGEREPEPIRKFLEKIKEDKAFFQSIKEYLTSYLFKKIEIFEDENNEFDLNSLETKQILQNIQQEDNCRSHVRKIGIYAHHKNNDELLNNLNIFENLQELILKKIKNETLKINNKNLKKIHIEQCKKFKQLDFNKEQTPSLSTIIIKNCPNFNISSLDKDIQKLVTIEPN